MVFGVNNEPLAAPRSSRNSVCVVGPNPALNVSGGVATHLRILSTLDVFSDAIFCDVGSRNGPRKASIAEIFRGYSDLLRQSKSAKFVLTNGSISAGSLFKVCLQILLIPPKRGRVVYVFFHGGSFETLGKAGRLCIALLKILRHRVSYFCFLTEVQQCGFLKQVGELPTKRYRNFSDSDVTLPAIPHGDVTNLLYVGRITEAKGVFESVEALEVLLARMPGRFNLIFVGDGDAVPEIRERIRGDLESAVEFRGYLQGEDLEKEYRRADLVLLPSSTEGFPYVFIEAMRAGVPMLATRVGALPELIQSSMNGYLVEKSKESLAEVIRKYVEKSPEHKQKMREYCYRCFKETLGRSSAEKFYRSLLGR